MKDRITVFTRCVTYNQALYIKDTLDGFCIQQTSFPFVCGIIDDASTDGEQEVIKQYLTEHFNLSDKSIARNEETDDYVRIFARHKDNKNCYFLVVLLKYNHYQLKKNKEQYVSDWINDSKYFAFCEGDDYWIDPVKLKKQVDFLDKNPDYGLVYTNHYNRQGDDIVKFSEKGLTTFEELLMSSGIGTLTSCFRTDLYLKYKEEIQPLKRNWLMGDAPLWKYLSYHSKVKFLPDYTAVYRVLPNSFSHITQYRKKIAFIDCRFDIQKLFIDLYVDDPIKKDSFLSKVTHDKNESVLDTMIEFGEYEKIKAFIKNNNSGNPIVLRIRIIYKIIRLKAKAIIKKILGKGGDYVQREK